MTTRTYQVPDISCGHCQSAIEGTVGDLDGVEQVAVDIESKKVTVDGDASDAQVRAAIEEAGYDVAST